MLKRLSAVSFQFSAKAKNKMFSGISYIRKGGDFSRTGGTDVTKSGKRQQARG
jgi:hypothetical protein